MTPLAPHDVEPIPEALEHLLDELPGGEHIKPHVEDGPWYIVCVREWSHANWQIEACLAAYPGTQEKDEVTFHVVPKFIWRMCQWHNVEGEASIDTEDGYAAGPYPTREQAQVALLDVMAEYDPEEDE